MMYRFVLCFLFAASSVAAQNRQHAFEINNRLGRGINYGNMFEAPSESAWGNPWKPEYAGMIAGLGFNHVRIPIRWEPAERSSAASPYTINPTFLNRIKQVVDLALKNKLHAIINMHHHEALFESPDGQKTRFLAQWKQISEYFKEYPDSLLFELLNEPHGNLTPEKWNSFVPEAIAKIREDNPNRIVVIGTAEYGGLGGLSKLQLPTDENIILTVHYYNPFQFTHQGAEWVGNGTEANAWLGTQWNDSETEREVIQQDFAPLVQYSKTNNIPVHIGEFGSYNKADITSRVKWTTFVARYLETLGWSWAYWEFSAGFGIFNPNTKKYNEDLANALLLNQIPEPAKYVGTPVYKSNLTASSDGWNLFTQQSAVGSMSRANNELKITISNGGTEGWHVQLVKNNIRLIAGKKYRFSFKAKAETTRSFTAYIGKNGNPWTTYSGYINITTVDTSQVFTFVFDQQVNDSAARIAFDFGKTATNVTISDFLLEEIVLQWPTSSKTTKEIKTILYPNPASNRLFVLNSDKFDRVSLLNINGSVIKTSDLLPGLNTVNLENLSPGVYFARLSGSENSFTSKILKK